MKRIFSESFISPRWVDSSTVNYRFPITSAGNESIPTRTRQDGYRSKPIKLTSKSIELIGSYRNALNRSGALVIYVWLTPTTIATKDGTASNVQLSTLGNMYFGELQAGPASTNGTSFTSSYTFDENVDFIQIYTTMDLTALTISETDTAGTAIALLSPIATTEDVTIEDDFELTEVSVPVLIEDPFSLGPDTDPFVTIEPISGSYSEPVLVQVSVTTPSTIYYTTDGTTPTTSSLSYTAPFYVFSNVTITALAFPMNGMAPEVTSATYTIVYAPSISPVSGVYADSVDVTIVAHAPTMAATRTRSTLMTATQPAIHYTTDTRVPTTDSATYTGALTVTANTVVKAVVATENTLSSAASANYTIVVAPTILPAGGSYTNYVTVTLSNPNALATIYYTLDGSTPTSSSSVYSVPLALNASATVKCLAAIDGVSSSVVSATYALPAAVPTITPSAGIYEFTQAVTITSDTGSTIYYTLDGSNPTIASNVYSTPITLDHSASVKAIAVNTLGASSSASQTYEIVYPTPKQAISQLYYDASTHSYLWKAKSLAAPTFSISSGSYNTAQAVSINAAVGASIYYTLDGSTPTASSTLYTTSITLSVPSILKAIAVSGSSVSTVASATYAINLSPTITAITPNDIQEGIAYDSITVTGSNLSSWSQVALNGIPCPVVSATNNFSSLSIKIPAKALWAQNNSLTPILIQVTNGPNLSQLTYGHIVPKWLLGDTNIERVNYTSIGDPSFGIFADGTGKPSTISISPSGSIYVKTPYRQWGYYTGVYAWDTTMSNIWYCGVDDHTSQFTVTPLRLTNNTTNSDTNVSSMCFDTMSNFYWSLPDGLYKGTPVNPYQFNWTKLIANKVFESLCPAASNTLYAIQTSVDHNTVEGSNTNTVYRIDTTTGTIQYVSVLPAAYGIGYNKLGCDPSTNYLYAIPNYCSLDMPILVSTDDGATWRDSGSGSLGIFTYFKEGPTFGDGALFCTSGNCIYRAAINNNGTLATVTKISSNAISNTVGVAYKLNIKPTLYITIDSDEPNSIKTLTRQF